ncbi:phosphotransferase family protein [Streptosporangium sp. NPDC005286]|uniref:phosphotransferase family protein n=1 Tax=Streptosporangium sp. NPDC005286 TaxID=3154463 RepID=UPI0033BEAB3F
MERAQTYLVPEIEAVCWLLRNSVDVLQTSIRPALAGLPAAHATRCVEVLAAAVDQLTRLAENGGEPPVFPALADELADIDRIQERLAAVKAPPAARTSPAGQESPVRHDLEAEELESYLREHPRGGANLRLHHLERMAGGRSKSTYALTVHDAADLPSDLVIRKDQETLLNNTSVVSEAKLLERLHRTGLKVPQPFHLESDPEALGSPFLILQRLGGTTAGEVFDPPRNERLALALAEQVGLLHSLDVGGLADDPFLVTKDVTGDQLCEQLAAFRATVNEFSEPYPSVLGALDWLDEHVRDFDEEVRLVHGDLGFHNVLAEGDELTAVLDWELASLGHPARDLGYLRSTIEMMTDWDKFLDAYHASGGVRCDPHAVDFYMLFSSVWLYQHLARSGRMRLKWDARNIEYTISFAVLGPNMRYRLARQLDGVLTRG